MRTELPSGAWIEHRPVQDLRGKDKDAVTMAVRMVIPMTADGEVDLSQGMTMGGELQIKSRNAVIARVITAWSFTAEDGGPLPVPEWAGREIVNEDSIGELPLDGLNEIEELIAPYLAKLRARPDPKGATTSSSNGLPRAKAHGSRRG